jgi:hypothetical protein
MPSLGLVIVPLSLFGISQELCSFSVTTLYITKEPPSILLLCRGLSSISSVPKYLSHFSLFLYLRITNIWEPTYIKTTYASCLKKPRENLNDHLCGLVFGFRQSDVIDRKCLVEHPGVLPNGQASFFLPRFIVVLSLPNLGITAFRWTENIYCSWTVRGWFSFSWQYVICCLSVFNLLSFSGIFCIT